MARELEEELGVALVSMDEHRLSARDPGTPFVVHFWRVSFSGEPSPREHAALRWVTREEARALPLAPSDRRFVDEAW
jgi:8-oxo-dGTP pyrophosphatase MutT (NUDIX family)